MVFQIAVNDDDIGKLIFYLRRKGEREGGDEKECDWVKGYNDCIQDVELFLRFGKETK